VAKESVAAKTVRPSNGLKRDDGWKGKAGRGGRLGRRTGVLNRQVGSEGRGQKVCYSRISVLCFFYSYLFLILVSAGDCAALTLRQLLRDTLHKVVGAPSSPQALHLLTLMHAIMSLQSPLRREKYMVVFIVTQQKNNGRRTWRNS
jgi:hypothetical protein